METSFTIKKKRFSRPTETLSHFLIIQIYVGDITFGATSKLGHC